MYNSNKPYKQNFITHAKDFVLVLLFESDGTNESRMMNSQKVNGKCPFAVAVLMRFVYMVVHAIYTRESEITIGY